MERNFKRMLEALWPQTLLGLGLDSDYNKIPAHLKARRTVEDAMFEFNRIMFETNYDLICSIKTQIAFYEAQGPAGIAAMIRTNHFIKALNPRMPIIVDAKRADIGNTNDAYVKAIFEVYGFDAVTIHPYLGREALMPFLNQQDKGIIILCRTSNPGAGEFQDLFTLDFDPRKKPRGMSAEKWLQKICDSSLPLYQRVALNVANQWNLNNNCCVVVGATYPQEAKEVRRIVGDMPFLVPGAGRPGAGISQGQGGDIEQIVLAAMDGRHWGMMVNISRDIIFASNGSDFASASRARALEFRDTINRYR